MMGDILKGAAEQEQEYLRLCRKYRESAVSAGRSYVEHLIQLEDRERTDREAAREREMNHYLDMATIEQLQNKIKEKKASIREDERRQRQLSKANSVLEKAKEKANAIMKS